MKEANSGDLFSEALEMMILESLRRQPAHGYALVQHIRQRQKLVKAEWGISSSNRRVRTYQITATGLRRLEEQVSTFERMFEGITLVLDRGKFSTR
jgi:PadR family transcriptional regulator, regulatory protein PadR